ncbi:hypothetical protein F6455_07325 [Proteobacteria bacterium 005FR1]|nr:hypothetical protein [Proteobacteria bacterium 005FR1]
MEMITLRKLMSTFVFALAVFACSALGHDALAQTNLAHHRDYLEALEKVKQAESRIALEMERLQFGELAHYDFLQFEHIELIRHARALAHPPAGLTQSASADIALAVEELLTSASELEWLIADFLRALATVRNASSNTLDIAAALKREAPAGLATKLDKLSQQTARFAKAGYETGWDELDEAFKAVLNASISEQRRRELDFQRQALESNAGAINQARQALILSDVDQHGERLAALYRF